MVLCLTWLVSPSEAQNQVDISEDEHCIGHVVDTHDEDLVGGIHWTKKKSCQHQKYSGSESC